MSTVMWVVVDVVAVADADVAVVVVCDDLALQFLEFVFAAVAAPHL